MNARSRHIVTLFSLLLLAACENDIQTIRKIASQKEVHKETVREVEVLYSDSGLIRAKLVAPELVRYLVKNSYVELPRGLRLYFFDANLKVESQLTANYGISYEDKREMVVRDNVVAFNSKGEKLMTEELVWDEKNGRIHSDKFVKITTPEEIIYGEGFEANQDFSEYKIRKIKGTINVKEDQIPEND